MRRKQSKEAFPHEVFDLSTTPINREYNALVDPHANYYFVSNAAKQRLKSLKKDIRREGHKRSCEEKEMLRLIKEKIKFKFPKIKLPLVSHKEMEGLIKSSRQHSLDRVALKYPDSANRNHREERPEKTGNQLKKSISSMNKRSFIGKTSINHSQFVQFLAQKKSQLIE